MKNFYSLIHHFALRFSAAAASLLLLAAGSAAAQDLSVSTNVLGYVNLGTLNMDASLGFARHFSAEAGFRYNPFTFKGRQGVADTMQSRQRTVSAGVRYWPWHIHSGWWLSGKAQYQEYNVGGLTEAETHEGDRYGAGVTGGYTYMVSPHFNVEFGLGIWTGYEKFTVYQCPTCGKIVDTGEKRFFLPNDALIGLVYVF